MAGEDRPRNSIEALIDRPLFEDDAGGRGIGPTLGVRAPHPQPAPHETDVWPSDEGEPDLFPETAERRPPEQFHGRLHEHLLGSEIAAAGVDLGQEVLRAPTPPGEDELPRLARIERARPGVAAPDLPAPPPGGRKPHGGF
jgi:hypothetical protein